MDESAEAGSEEALREIEVESLTTYEVSPDGWGVRMNVIDAAGRPARVVLPIDCLRSLALSMPKMISDTISGGCGDPNVRVVHNVAAWHVERSQEGLAILLTIETGDGMPISFAMMEKELVEMADGLSGHEVEAFSAPLRCH